MGIDYTWYVFGSIYLIFNYLTYKTAYMNGRCSAIEEHNTYLKYLIEKWEEMYENK